jgi:hypothetical protein
MDRNMEDHVILQALRVDALYCHALTPMLSLLFGALSILIYFWSAGNVYPMLYWFALLCVITALRCLLIYKYKQSTIEPNQYPVWLKLYMIGVLSTATVWGSTIYIVPADNNYIDIGAVTMLMLIVISLSTGIYSVFHRIYYGLCIPMIVPLIYFLISHEDEQLHKMGNIAALYTGFVFVIQYHAHKIINQLLMIKFDNKLLLDSYEKDQDKIDILNRLNNTKNKQLERARYEINKLRKKVMDL